MPLEELLHLMAARLHSHIMVKAQAESEFQLAMEQRNKVMVRKYLGRIPIKIYIMVEWS